MGEEKHPGKFFMERCGFPCGIKILCPHELVKSKSHGNSAAGGYDNVTNKSCHSVRSVGENEARALCITLMHIDEVEMVHLIEAISSYPCR